MICLGLLAGLLLSASPSPAETIKISQEPLCPGRISPMQYGQFMEYLCDLVPGMWSEKLDDGGFEGLSPYKFEFIRQTDFKQHPWYPTGDVNQGKFELDKEDPYSGQTSQRIQSEGGPSTHLGIAQDGIAVDPSDPCTLSIWIRSKGVTGPLRVSLRDRDQIPGKV